MPFIDCKITQKLTDGQKENLKTELGKSISILHKPESYLMVGVADGYDLFFAGKKLESGAFVSISLFGKTAATDCEKMTSAVCDILERNFGIAPSSVYVTYQGIEDWGWNGENF